MSFLAPIVCCSSLACAGPPGTGSQEADTGTESSSAPEPLAWGELDVLLHDQQPMVVDLRVQLSKDASLSVEHIDDPGVRVARLDASVVDGGVEEHLRVRGLAPDADHTLRLVAEAATASGELESIETELEFHTGPPLPGYIESFEVEQTGPWSWDGYRLFDLSIYGEPQPSGAYVVDAAGRTRWYTGRQVNSHGIDLIHTSVRLRDDGTLYFLLRGGFMVLDELGEKLVHLTAEDLEVPRLHHGVLELPNGHFVALSLEYRDIDYGAPLGVVQVAGDELVEFDLEGQIHWRWSSFDHLDPSRIREGWELSIPNPANGLDARDWTHGNGMAYDAEGDALYLSLRHQDWILKIDHQSGEVLWRLGDEGDFELQGDPATDWFFHQHSPQWHQGQLQLYDNGISNPYLDDAEERSRVARYELDDSTMQATLVWQDDDQSFMSTIAGDVDGIDDGHLLVLDSAVNFVPPFDESYGRIRLLDEGASPMQQWKLRSPDGTLIYRAEAIERLIGEPE